MSSTDHCFFNISYCSRTCHHLPTVLCIVLTVFAQALPDELGAASSKLNDTEGVFEAMSDKRKALRRQVRNALDLLRLVQIRSFSVVTPLVVDVWG